MRAVHSFDPCLPCGVHMYGKGKVRKVVHTPTGMAVGGDASSRAPEEELVGRVQALTARGRGAARPARRGSCADELAGGGASSSTARGSSGSSRRSSPSVPRALAEDGVVASLMLIHGLYPVPLEDRVQEALGRCGPTWSPTAATSSCSGLEDGVARLRLQGSLQRLRGVAERRSSCAIERALRGDGARPARHRRRGRRRRRRRAAAAAPRATSEWVELDGVRLSAGMAARRRALVVTAAPAAGLARRQRRRDAARLPRRAARAAARR